MKSPAHLGSPPAKPLVIYDGDCNFCARWVRRWERTTSDYVGYLPFQAPTVAARFPELTTGGLGSAVHLLEPDGSVWLGAEAVFRALAHNPHERWLLDWYEHSAVFRNTTERAYAFVARYRPFFSALTRIAFGSCIEPSEHLLVRSVFLRGLGLVYLIAFASLWVQLPGLIGNNGILPARLTMQTAQLQLNAAKIGPDRYHVLPTLCWFSTSDWFLNWQCGTGLALSAFLLAGVAPGPCLFLLWLIYLSLTAVGRDFLEFQWDNLLLETGLLAIFLAPPRLWLSRRRTAPPSRLVLWLFRWLLFRLMFESGCVKLLSGNPVWRNLTALTYHYETQPLPTWLGWYANLAPTGFQKVCALVMFGIELVVPWLVFGPRRAKQLACVLLVGFQVIIMATGNYCFFNLLTIWLCVPLLNDRALERLLPARWRGASTPNNLKQPVEPRPKLWLRKWATIPLACVVLAVSLMGLQARFGANVWWPRPLAQLYQWAAPLRSINGYGLFAVMTTSRLEIIVEGSDDGVSWLAYEFKYKPGDVGRRPRFVEPHQPRLDWQMWFAALGNYRQNPWFVSFCMRLLQGTPEVLALLERNPFPEHPPRYVRAELYQYHLTDWATRKRTGNWWRRELKGEYLPVISIRERQQSL